MRKIGFTMMTIIMLSSVASLALAEVSSQSMLYPYNPYWNMQNTQNLYYPGQTPCYPMPSNCGQYPSYGQQQYQYPAAYGQSQQYGQTLYPQQYGQMLDPYGQSQPYPMSNDQAAYGQTYIGYGQRLYPYDQYGQTPYAYDQAQQYPMNYGQVPYYGQMDAGYGQFQQYPMYYDQAQNYGQQYSGYGQTYPNYDQTQMYAPQQQQMIVPAPFMAINPTTAR